SILDSTYTDPAVANNIAWGPSSAGADVSSAPSATPMTPIHNVVDWVAGTVRGVAAAGTGNSPGTTRLAASPSGTSLNRHGTAGAEPQSNTLWFGVISGAAGAGGQSAPCDERTQAGVGAAGGCVWATRRVETRSRGVSTCRVASA
ncbi:hypothetical protein MKK50_22530, partial [Methylobacterium sp. J-043]|nr:hypothetical protein [Methylobacterium sp. J-043]